MPEAAGEVGPRPFVTGAMLAAAGAGGWVAHNAVRAFFGDVFERYTTDPAAYRKLCLETYWARDLDDPESSVPACADEVAEATEELEAVVGPDGAPLLVKDESGDLVPAGGAEYMHTVAGLNADIDHARAGHDNAEAVGSVLFLSTVGAAVLRAVFRGKKGEDRRASWSPQVAFGYAMAKVGVMALPLAMAYYVPFNMSEIDKLKNGDICLDIEDDAKEAETAVAEEEGRPPLEYERSEPCQRVLDELGDLLFDTEELGQTLDQPGHPTIELTRLFLERQQRRAAQRRAFEVIIFGGIGAAGVREVFKMWERGESLLPRRSPAPTFPQ